MSGRHVGRHFRPQSDKSVASTFENSSLNESRWWGGHAWVPQWWCQFDHTALGSYEMCGCERDARCLAEHELEALSFTGSLSRSGFLLGVDCGDDFTEFAGAVAAEGFGKGLLYATFLRVTRDHPAPCAQLQQ